MQYRVLTILLFGLPVLIFQSCTDMLCILSGYKPSEIKNTCDTPEPGTKLSPRCNLILKHADKYIENPDSLFDSQRQLLAIMKAGVKVIEDIHIPVDTSSILIRLYCNVPENKRHDLPVLVYYHGGGFIWGSVEIFDNYCRKIARETETVLISVDYRLAPEYPFPYAVNDSYSVLKWVEDNIEKYGGDPGKIIVMGESAGGNLAAVMPIVSRDSSGPDIQAQVIICGATTFDETEFPSRKYFLLGEKYYFVSKDYLQRCKSAYLQDNADVSNPYVSPLKADLDEFMPPALVITAQVDPLRDEGREYAMKMKEAGIDVVYLEYEGMIHAFMNFYPFLDAAREAIDDLDKFIDNVAGTGTD
ncbi:MAG: alpha/beta hydrolase [Bacteroidales bacterium]|nr:alpha/beta hydrolase [Bacteroidales bacterium]